MLVLACALGCGAPGPRPAAAKDPTAERLVARLCDYVYATYEVDATRSEAALGKLRHAREALAATMVEAGLAGTGEGLPGMVGELRDHFLAHGDLIFVPLGPETAGILLVRVAERREVHGRAIDGLEASYKLVVFDEAPIEDLESWRRRASGGPPARPVARASGKTIYVDRGIALRLAREVVIPRAAAAEALEARVARGERLAAVEEKDLLRDRALAAEIREGEEAVARKIAAEEELRLAALLAASPAGPRALEDPANAARVERTATLAAAAAGDPRYHLASALAATIAAPGTPPAAGAAEALAVYAGRPLDAYTPDELQARAKAALAGGR